ncbi:MAG: 50S ribosomal protein L25 [Gammaproteobacteria bacterium]
MSEITITAEKRADCGRGAARALRRGGRVPAVIYGGKQPEALSCSARDLDMLLRGAVSYSAVLTVSVGGGKRRALLREAQYHPVRNELLHVDLQEVSEKQEIAAGVQLRFAGADASPGVKLEHGIFSTIENQVLVHCRAMDLPEYIEVDVSKMKIGDTIHLSDIVPPSGVRFDALVRGNDPALAVVSAARAEEAPAEPADAATAETGTEGAAAAGKAE